LRRSSGTLSGVPELAAALPIARRGWRTALIEATGVAAILGLLASSIVIAVDAAAAPGFLVPAGRHVFPGWLAGPLQGLNLGEPTTWNKLGGILIALTVCWLVVLACVPALRTRTLIIGIVAAHVVFLLAPPLFSADVFGYVGFAREGVLHHLDPYTNGWAAALAHDPIRPFIQWHDVKSAYGPLFTVLSYAVVPLGIAGAMWTFKVLTFACSLATCALVWRIAQRRSMDSRAAVAFVGLNPALLVFEVGGGHNDMLIMLPALIGIALLLRGRPQAGMASVVAAAGAKISMGIVAPFALIGATDRKRGLIGAAIAVVAVIVVGEIAFSGGAGGFLQTLPATSFVAEHAVPVELSRHLFGQLTFSHFARLLADAFVLAGCAWALWRSWRGHDWIAGAGWATLAVLVGTTWLLPWYVVWTLPLAALGASRPLRWASAVFTLYVVATRIPFLIG
jgi:alpha-1,6-mannosyltransferase